MKKASHRRVKISRLRANTWNPNEMSVTYYRKLKAGIRKTLDEAGEIPDVIVRLDSNRKGYFEIIDGFHRWKILQELNQDMINIHILRVSDSTARLLTNTLNYLRGSPDRTKYAKGLVELIEHGITPDLLEEWLPETGDELDQLLEEADITALAFEKLTEQEEKSENNIDKGKDENIWVDLHFKVPLPIAQVVERELSRIGENLKGKSVRMRALEFMAVQSSQTPIPHDLT